MKDRNEQIRKHIELSAAAYNGLSAKEKQVAEQLHLAAHGEMRQGYPAPLFSKMAANFTANNIKLQKQFAELPVSVADSKLQADIEALTKRVSAIENPVTLPTLGSSEVNTAAWFMHDELAKLGPINGHQFNNIKGIFYQALEKAMGKK